MHMIEMRRVCWQRPFIYILHASAFELAAAGNYKINMNHRDTRGPSGFDPRNNNLAEPGYGVQLMPHYIEGVDQWRVWGTARIALYGNPEGEKRGSVYSWQTVCRKRYYWLLLRQVRASLPLPLELRYASHAAVLDPKKMK